MPGGVVASASKRQPYGPDSISSGAWEAGRPQPAGGCGRRWRWRGEEPVRDERSSERGDELLSAGDLQRPEHPVMSERRFGSETRGRETATG